MGKRTERKRIKRRQGPLPDILRKGAAHRDRTKYRRKDKHVHNQETPDTDG